MSSEERETGSKPQNLLSVGRSRAWSPSAPGLEGAVWPAGLYSQTCSASRPLCRLRFLGEPLHALSLRPLPAPAPPPPRHAPCMTSKAPGWPPSPFLRLEAERSSGHAGALPGTALGVRPKPLKRPPGPPTSAASALAASPRPLPARQAQCLPFPEGARSSASPGPVPGSP